MLSKISINNWYHRLVYYIWSLEDPISWIIDPSAESILDLGCGQGNTTKVIKARHTHIKRAVGVELFDEYIEAARNENIFEEVIKKDVRQIVFPDNSFDVVIASQVIEHLEQEEAWKLIEKMNKIARKQVIVSTPIGECYHPEVDGNELQLHKSYYFPKDLELKGFKTVRYGWKWLLDSHTNGLVYKTQNSWVRKFLYGLNFLLTPVYYLFQSSCDYIFVGYRNKQL